MTYADLDGYETVRLIQARKSSAEYLSVSVSTNANDTGQRFAVQTEGGIQQTSSTGDTNKAPGLNVPFDYAARFGDHVQLASDGVSQPAAPLNKLADFIGANVEIGSTGKVNIKRVRFWFWDIAQAGIEKGAPL